MMNEENVVVLGGHSIDDPQFAHVRLLGTRSAVTTSTRSLAAKVVRSELQRLPSLRDELVAGRVSLY